MPIQSEFPNCGCCGEATETCGSCNLPDNLVASINSGICGVHSCALIWNGASWLGAMSLPGGSMTIALYCMSGTLLLDASDCAFNPALSVSGSCLPVVDLNAPNFIVSSSCCPPGDSVMIHITE